jgi:hypothetical protein
MTRQPEPSSPIGLALVYSRANFERALGRAHVVNAFRRSDVILVVVDLGAEHWKALDANEVAEHVSSKGALAESTTGEIVGWFRDRAIDATPDFGNRRITFPNRLAQSVTFVPSGIQVPGIVPSPTGDETYICNGDETHIVVRPLGSTDATCGEPRADGTPCTGTLTVR